MRTAHANSQATEDPPSRGIRARVCDSKLASNWTTANRSSCHHPPLPTNTKTLLLPRLTSPDPSLSLFFGNERHIIQSVEVCILSPNVGMVHACGGQNDTVSHWQLGLQAQVRGE